MSRVSFFAGLLFAATAGACFSPNYGNPGFACGADRECPSGYECQSDGICHRDGTGVDLPDADPNAPDADPNAPDADPNAPDAGLADASPGPDADTKPNTCTNPGALTESVEVLDSILNAGDDLAISCGGAGNDTVHELSFSGARDLLVVAAPQTDWDLHVSLRAQAGCSTTADIACVPDAFSTRYINVANQPGGAYDVVIDGSTDGVYSLRYETRAVDTGHGYWQQRTTGTYVPLIGGAVQSIAFSDGADEVVSTVPLPFTFSFFGEDQNAINIHTNGFASFETITAGAVSENYDNDCSLDATTPFNMIAPFWDDFFAVAGTGDGVAASTIKHELQGTEPYRRFVIEWANWHLLESDPCTAPGGKCYVLGTSMSHQAILHEGGDIEFHYGARNAPTTQHGCATPHLGCSATIGLRNSDGLDNDEFGCNMPTLIDNGTIIYFVHPTN